MTINTHRILSTLIVFSLPTFSSAMSGDNRIAHPYEKSHFSNDVHLYRSAHKRTLSQQEENTKQVLKQENSAQQDHPDAAVTLPKPKNNYLCEEGEETAPKVVQKKYGDTRDKGALTTTTAHCCAMIYHYK